MQWEPTFNGDQSDTDSPTSSLEKARQWKVLAGDYMADKGFKIHDMLARYHILTS